MSQDKTKTKADEIFLRGLAFYRQGHTAKAVASFLDAVKQNSRHADSLHMLGVCKAQKGELASAIQLMRAAVEIKPAYPGYRFNLAKALELTASDVEAEVEYLEVLKLDARNVDALINLSCLMLGRSKSEAAKQFAERALELQADSLGAQNNLALALNALDQSEEAEQILLGALQRHPDSADTLVNLSRIYKRRDRYQDAIACLRKAVSINPELPEALSNLASVLKFEGKLDEALVYFRKALRLAPNVTVHSNLLFTLNYHPDYSATDVFQEHLAWGQRYANGLSRAAAFVTPESIGSRRLRIGYVSPDFKQHAVATFLKPILAHHDKSNFEIFCYSDVSKADDSTRWFQHQCDVWQDIVGMTDAEVAGLIRKDRIDILIDLAGHTSGGSRLLIFARKPAPLQMSYLGYLGTTGMDAMDYKITDAAMDPEGVAERYHTERLLRLPHSMWCYSPPGCAPETACSPAVMRGHITFGSFNNSAKVNPKVIDAWCQILHALPNARLIMVTKGDGGVHEYFMGQFVGHGIAHERIDLRSRMSLAEYLKLHAEVDIQLDTFPYTGGTTTCHSLWMGVPVLTCPGEKPFSRSGASILHGLGLDDWVVDSVQDYIETAVIKAADVSALQSLRSELRSRMQASPLTNGMAFTRTLEHAYRMAWNEKQQVLQVMHDSGY